MSRYIELMNKKKRTELEELEYDYLDKTYQLNGLIQTAKSLGNKNWRDNAFIKQAYKNYLNAKQKYEEMRNRL